MKDLDRAVGTIAVCCLGIALAYTHTGGPAWLIVFFGLMFIWGSR